jgi:hypothetical protein
MTMGSCRCCGNLLRVGEQDCRNKWREKMKRSDEMALASTLCVPKNASPLRTD